MNNLATKIAPKIKHVLSAEILALRTQRSLDFAAIARQNWAASYSSIRQEDIKEKDYFAHKVVLLLGVVGVLILAEMVGFYG